LRERERERGNERKGSGEKDETGRVLSSGGVYKKVNRFVKKPRTTELVAFLRCVSSSLSLPLSVPSCFDRGAKRTRDRERERESGGNLESLTTGWQGGRGRIV